MVKEEELPLFFDLQKREKENNDLSLDQDYVDSDGSNHGSSPIANIVSSMPARKMATDEFLNSENEKPDYNWLLSPPGTPLFPYLEVESQKTKVVQMGIPDTRPFALKARPANSQPESNLKSDVKVKKVSSTPALKNVSNAGNTRPSSSGRRASTNCRPATPTERGTLPATVGQPSRRPTPTRSTSRSSTPTARLPVQASKSTSRSATPSNGLRVSAPPRRSSSVTKSALTTSKISVSSHGVSPPVKSQPWKPSEMPGFSNEAPPNIRTSVPGRPASASKGRPGAASAPRSSIDATKGKPRQQSCSPSRGQSNGSSVSAKSRMHSNGNDNVSPVLIGTQMVERVINMRKLAPPKQDNCYSSHGNSVGDRSGFGRTLSKKSLDMAIRHMDITRSISGNGNLRPIMTKIPASSVYSVGSRDSKSRTVSFSDSPLATSSSASSEPSINYNSSCLDGSEMEDDDSQQDR